MSCLSFFTTNGFKLYPIWVWSGLSPLQNRRPTKGSPDDLIFTSTNGCAMAYRPASYDSKNFCKRYWKPALGELGIDYRRPYTTRHTLISHGWESGMDPVAVASLIGHNVRTLYENSAGLVNPARLPDLLPALNPAFDPVLSPVSEVDSPVDRSDTSP